MQLNLKQNFNEHAKSFPWGLWISLCLLGFIPGIFDVIRTAFVSTSSPQILDIIGQMEWFDLIDETIKAFLIVPLYSLLNHARKRNVDGFPNTVFKAGILVFFCYMIFCLCLLFYGNSLIRLMNPNMEDIHLVSEYLMLELCAFLIGIIPNYFNVVFVVLGKKRNVYVFLVLRVLLGIASDFALIPLIGAKGVAISNIISSGVLALVGYIVLFLEKQIRVCWFSRGDGRIVLEWIRIGSFSGLQQFIDNFIYAVMIVRMVNMVSEQGNYWVSNNFIWGWLLVPISSLSEIIKGDARRIRKDDIPFYMILLAMVCSIWFLSIPGWIPFLRDCEKLENYDEIFRILLKLVPFYIFYAFSVFPDSIFIKNGKTYFNMICSLLVNLVYYGIWFVCYRFLHIDFDMSKIVLMFGFGMVFHTLISWAEFIWFGRKTTNGF